MLFALCPEVRRLDRVLFTMEPPTPKLPERSLPQIRHGLWHLFLGILCCLVISTTKAQEGAERLAYDAALRDFDLGQWERAVGSLGAFSTTYPDSALRAEVESRLRFAEAERS